MSIPRKLICLLPLRYRQMAVTASKPRTRSVPMGRLEADDMDSDAVWQQSVGCMQQRNARVDDGA